MMTEVTTPEALVDELTYRSYRFNRLNSPSITPERWKKVFPGIDEFEKRFQEERKDAQ